MAVSFLDFLEPLRGGRPPFEPEPNHRALVETLTAVGASQEEICRQLAHIGAECTSVPTLQKHFPEELRNGAERIRTRRKVRVHELAMGPHPGVSLAACCLLLRVFGEPERREEARLDGDTPPAPVDPATH
jgi:hypothetical protein